MEISITKFTATDNVGVTGYIVTEEATAPAATAEWSPTPTQKFRFKTTGPKTLYAWAKDAAGNVSTGLSAQVTITTTTRDLSQEEKDKFWTNWGAGLIANFASAKKRPIKSASIVGASTTSPGVVRVDSEEYFMVGLGLEVHKFLWGNQFPWEHKRGTFLSQYAVGPYVSVMPGNNIINAVGAGLIFGFFGESKAEGTSSPSMSKFSMNLGGGGYAAPNTQILGDGFEEGQAPPPGETTVRYKQVTSYGWQAILSFNYNW